MFNNRKMGSSDSLLDTIKGIMEKNHTTPETPKEKALAKLAHPKDKITHKDVLVGRGVLKKENSGDRMGVIVGTRKEKVEIEPKLKEGKQVAELKQSTVKSYTDKANKQLKKIGKKMMDDPDDHDGLDDKEQNTLRKRMAGFDMTFRKGVRASQKTTKEEVEQVGEAAKWRKGPEGKSWKSNPMRDPDDDEGAKAVYGSSKLPNVPAHKATGKITKDTYAKLGSRKSVSKLKYRGGIGFGPKGKLPEEVENVDERKLTGAEAEKKEKYVLSMKKKMGGFKQRYGERAKEVMYATATKMAKEEIEQMDEISLKTAKSALTQLRDPEADYNRGNKENPKNADKQADNVSRMIKKKHGAKAASDAERSARRTHWGEGVHLDELEKKKYVDLMRKASDPSYGSGNTDRIAKRAEKEHGAKFAKQLQGVPDSHFPRRGHSLGSDALKRASSPRITKAGKINKQDVEPKKAEIKMRLGRHKKPNLPEGK